MPNLPQKRPRTEIIIAIAATVVSICAMVTTVYQTYILRQQQHAAVWPRLQLAHGYWVQPDTSHYQLFLQNNGIGPAIIRQVAIEYQDSLFISTASLARTVALQHGLSDTAVYTNYSDLFPDMVIPQQETYELLRMRRREYIVPWVEEVRNLRIRITVRYESLYGEAWEVSYPDQGHRKVD